MSEKNTPRDPNPKDAIASDRLDMSLYPATAVALGALKMSEGGFKYGPYNYRAAPVKASVYLASLKRHLEDFENGDDYDEHGIHSLGGVISSAGIMVDAIAAGTLIDDRPPKIAMNHLLDRCRRKVSELREKFKSYSPPRYTNAEHGPTPGRSKPGMLVRFVNEESDG